MAGLLFKGKFHNFVSFIYSFILETLLRVRKLFQCKLTQQTCIDSLRTMTREPQIKPNLEVNGLIYQRKI